MTSYLSGRHHQIKEGEDAIFDVGNENVIGLLRSGLLILFVIISRDNTVVDYYQGTSDAIA